MRRIYFDNAATSKPKPKNVLDAINGYLEDICTSPGGGYALGLEAGRIILKQGRKLSICSMAKKRKMLYLHKM